MNTSTREVRRGNRLIDLTPREYAVLEYLMRHPDQVLTRTQIGEHVWNFDFYHESNVIDVYVGYLRRKVQEKDEAPLIHTVRGVGYRLSDEESEGEGARVG
jgi:DNA-binding response OmpR family regulator